MTIRSWCAPIVAGFAVTGVIAQPAAPPPRDLVYLDVAVVDDGGRPAAALGRDAFTVREDGQPVRIDSIRQISAGVNGVKRGVAVVLDDANVSPVYTVNIQAIARAFLSRANAPDFLSVTTLSRRQEELTPDLRQSETRVAEFRAGSVVALANETFAAALRRLTGIARELALVNDTRNTIVCIGSPLLFDLIEPPPGAAAMLRPAWVDLMHVLAQTNTNIYLIDPAGLTGRMRLRDGGLVTDSGGESFVNSNDFDRAADRIWSQAGHYYVLSYAPTGPERVLHSIDVSVRGRGLHVHARRFRGDFHPPTG
jgi:VWFA-related protein